MAGEYREIEEKSFFDVGKKHECVVCHFAASSRRNSVVPGGGSSGGFGAGACAMLDALLPELGARYELTAFVRINVALASFLCRNFSIETSSCPAPHSPTDPAACALSIAVASRSLRWSTS